MNMKKNNAIALNKRAIGEITYCQRVYDTHRDTKYWDASAEISVDGNKYYGKVNVNSHMWFNICKISFF